VSILLTGWVVMAGAAVLAAVYEMLLLAGRDNPAGRQVRRLMVGPQTRPTVLPALTLAGLMLACEAVAVALAPLVIAAEAVALARRHRRGEAIGPAPWPQATGPQGGQAGKSEPGRGPR
jgi:hypothetical protein